MLAVNAFAAYWDSRPAWADVTALGVVPTITTVGCSRLMMQAPGEERQLGTLLFIRTCVLSAVSDQL